MEETGGEEFSRCASGSDDSVSTTCSDIELDISIAKVGQGWRSGYEQTAVQITAFAESSPSQQAGKK